MDVLELKIKDESYKLDSELTANLSQDPFALFDCTQVHIEPYTCFKCPYLSFNRVEFHLHSVKHLSQEFSFWPIGTSPDPKKTRNITEKKPKSTYKCKKKKKIAGGPGEGSYVVREEAGSKWYHCRQCEYKSKYHTNLKRHLQTVHSLNEQVQWFQCQECDFQTQDKKALRIHYTSNHSKEDEPVRKLCDNLKGQNDT